MNGHRIAPPLVDPAARLHQACDILAVLVLEDRPMLAETPNRAHLRRRAETARRALDALLEVL